MATQIASTPVIKNKEVITAIIREVNKKPSQKSKLGVKKLEEKFNNIFKVGKTPDTPEKEPEMMDTPLI